MAKPVVQAKGALLGAASGTTITPSVPAHQADDILICMSANNGGQSISTPAGWNVLGAVVSDANFAAGCFWLRATGSGTTVTVTHGAAATATLGHYAQVYVIRGCRGAGDPFDSVANVGAPDNTNRPQWGPISSLTDDCLAWAMTWHEGAFPTWNAAVLTGYTEEDQTSDSTATDAAGVYDISRVAAVPRNVTIALSDFVNSPGTKSTTTYCYSVAAMFASKHLEYGRFPNPARPLIGAS